ncbi:orotate phosphoribosyltransferase [Campylobacter sp. RM10532]|uniref:Orotate phosphoribosyltransferase n=1 Tax=Campylobacter molothri TaxID=1032242 RepID=A0ACC5W231_9BACT|nr:MULTISPECIES: orotate phosphoribosyltransferase [unclassified Campylobacter]MBZ7929004.1 orotate phosphoribosyltransferase [Campylobacter sp. RM10542]MBZ7930396.1 orotate phosphoribosyltransferase [Campylobacter sp. W0067]MBZ7931885.1 orotate phosphoribosyltransferase [Campylobacter sp. RM12910]MBZ7933330.1 orotate phosphoribosyltransferase [Campylobacter sp. RM10543]MBZ7934846.1 orotate phosphoribosyltransferase [Campylobacter sp. W0065]MBZ7942641.1 orotate phosphoribosyltransferase [Camp
MNLEEIYKNCQAYLEGHFLLSSGKHSQFYLQSAKVLEDPALAEKLCKELAKIIFENSIEFDSICSPALGGILAGYELARASNKRFIFTERVNKEMTLRRGFAVKKGEKFIICEDIITTGGSALESAKIIENLGGIVVGFAALANRGFCAVKNLNTQAKDNAKLPSNIPLFTLGNFDFEIYDEEKCPLCQKGSKAIKPGSRGN